MWQVFFFGKRLATKQVAAKFKPTIYGVKIRLEIENFRVYISKVGHLINENSVIFMGV